MSNTPSNMGSLPTWASAYDLYQQRETYFASKNEEINTLVELYRAKVVLFLQNKLANLTEQEIEYGYITITYKDIKMLINQKHEEYNFIECKYNNLQRYEKLPSGDLIKYILCLIYDILKRLGFSVSDVHLYGSYSKPSGLTISWRERTKKIDKTSCGN